MAKIKGVLLALGTLLLAVAVMALSITLYNTYIESEEKITNLRKIERLNELDKSIQEGLRIILKEDWGFNVSIDQGTRIITFNEGLVNPARDIGELGLSTPLSDYESFVEEKYNVSPRINISDYVLERIYNDLVVFIKPHMAVYKHSSADNEVMFIPEKQEHIAKCGTPCVVNGYKIIFVVDEDDPGMDIISAPSTCTGASCLRVEIEVRHIDGTEIETDFMVVDPEALSTASINFDNPEDNMEIKIDNPAKLTIKEEDLSADIKSFSINITFSRVGYPYELLEATLEENLINIRMEDLGTVKTSTAVIG